MNLNWNVTLDICQLINIGPFVDPAINVPNEKLERDEKQKDPSEFTIYQRRESNTSGSRSGIYDVHSAYLKYLNRNPNPLTEIYVHSISDHKMENHADNKFSLYLKLFSNSHTQTPPVTHCQLIVLKNVFYLLWILVHHQCPDRFDSCFSKTLLMFPRYHHQIMCIVCQPIDSGNTLYLSAHRHMPLAKILTYARTPVCFSLSTLITT